MRRPAASFLSVVTLAARSGLSGRARAGLICMMVGFSLFAGLYDATAQEFRVTPSVTARAIFTDNDNFERNGDEELILQFVPRVQVSRPLGRFSLALDASLAFQYSVLDDEFELRNTGQTGLAMNTQFEIIDNFFFVDALAAISNELPSAQAGRIRREAGEESDFELVQRYRVSPFVVYDLGSFAQVENRLTAGYVHAGSGVDSAVETGASVQITSGRLFSNVGWSLLGEHVRIEEGNGETFEKSTAAASLTVPLSRSFSLLGTAGIDRIEDDSLNRAPDGFFWNAGFRARPGPKLDLTATYGKRYERDDIFFDLSYRATARTALSASYTQTVQSAQQILLNDLQFLGRDEDGNLIDLRTNELVDITEGLDNYFGLIDDTVRRNRFNARLLHSRRRDTFALDGFYETRESLAALVARDQTVYGGEVSWDRRLSRSTLGSLALNYRRGEYEREPAREDDLITFRARLSYDITPTLSSTGSYIFRRRFSSDPNLEATENVVILSLTKRF